MKQDFREVQKSFVAGYFLGILVAFVVLYAGNFAGVSHSPVGFVPNSFSVSRLNIIVLQLFYVLFGGFVLGSLVAFFDGGVLKIEVKSGAYAL